MIDDPLVRALKATPLLQAIMAEAKRAVRVKSLLVVLKARFGELTPTVTFGLERVKEDAQFNRLIDHAASCPNLEAFEEALRKELPARALASTRGNRRPRKPRL